MLNDQIIWLLRNNPEALELLSKYLEPQPSTNVNVEQLILDILNEADEQ